MNPRPFDKIGEKYSKLTESQRERKIKEIRKKLNEIKEKNRNIDRQYEALSNQRVSEYQMERHLELLTHHYKIGDWVVMKEDCTNGTSKYKPVQIKKLIGIKVYLVMEHSVGLKDGCVRDKIHENQIVCGIEEIHSFGELKFYDHAYEGKVGFKESKCQKKK